MRLVRPLGTASNTAGTQEEQQFGFEKGLGFERIKSNAIVFIRLGIPSIGLSLHMYRPGKTYPSTSRFTKGFLIKI
jgi:hypothetical protein